jgi:YbbR domain-containing protein
MWRWFGTNLNLKIIALLLALLLWAHVTTERRYEWEFELPLRIMETNGDLVLVSNPPEFVTLRLRGKGKRLLRLRFSYPSVYYWARDIEQGENIVPLNRDVLELVGDPEVTIVSVVEPARMRLTFDRLAGKVVPLVASTEGEAARGCLLVGTPRAEPEEVTLRGPEGTVRVIPHLETSPVDIEGLSTSAAIWARVLLPRGRGFQVEPESVFVHVTIEPEEEQQFDSIPVRLVHGRSLEGLVSPSTIDLLVSGPESQMATLSASMISVFIDVSDLEPGEYVLPARIDLPPGIALVKADPKVFSVALTEPGRAS